MHEITKPSERRKYRRYDMPTEKRDAFLLWDDQALRVECVNFSAGGCAVFSETKVEFKVGQIVVLKNDQGKFRVTIANIANELGGVRLGCEYIESVVTEYEMIQSLKPAKQRKFKATSLSDPTMMVGLLVFGILACVIYTVVSNFKSGEGDNNGSDSKIAATRTRQNDPKDFSAKANRSAKKQHISQTMIDMQKRVKILREESRKYLEKIRQRIVGFGILMKRMGIDTDAMIESLRNVSFSDENPKNGTSENNENTESETVDD